MSEPGMSLLGPATGHYGNNFVMMLPLRKSTAGQFIVEAIETAVEVMLVDSLPAGVEIDRMKPIEKQWSDELYPTPGQERRVLVRMSCFTKEKKEEATDA